MKVLDKKLLRDLWAMKSQALAIALVITSGVATYVMSLSTMDSLKLTQKSFYQDHNFADVFASLKRAPESLRRRLEQVPDIEQVETRVVAEVKLDVEGYANPVTGRLVSLPDSGEPIMNRLYLRQGRLINPGSDDEVVVGEAFAQAHRFKPGDRLGAVINGRLRNLTLVGIALSPEYIFQIKPASIFPDFERYGVLWMSRTAMAAAYNMEGAFNDVTFKVAAGAKVEDVLDRLDLLLDPYGSQGAYGRHDQMSHRYLSEEFRQLAQMAFIFPVIFMGVAAFLLNVVISRLVNTQREQAAALKAFGYGNLDIGWHYLKLVLAIVIIGAAGGIAAGVWLGQGLGRMYMEFYRFPFLLYHLQPRVPAVAVLASAAAAILGTIYSVRRAALLPPAVAMRPEPPARYRETSIERLGFKRYLAQPTRMIMRNIERKPLKALLSVVGIAFACAIIITGGFFEDAVDYIIYVQFNLTQREDLSVTLVEPAARKALYELTSLPGVEYGEVFRSVPARFRFGHRRFRTSILGVEPESRLFRLLDMELKPFEPPPEGIVLCEYLARMLGVRPGDRLTVEVLEGNRPVKTVPVAGLINQLVGVSGYMELGALNRLMGEGHLISGAYLTADHDHRNRLYRTLHERPRVAGTEVQEEAIKNFKETMSRQALIFTSVITILATTIAFGVVYNSARIALAERSRELASLRVLGFTRGEIAYILLGELTVLTLASIPLGFLIGRLLCLYMVTNMENELFRVPIVIQPATFAFAATVVLVSGFFSALIVKRRLNRLDLVAVLKTKE
ncbi:MAG: FtsX-like permease family protein [Thermodesulfobacteriota bacterium]